MHAEFEPGRQQECPPVAATSRWLLRGILPLALSIVGLLALSGTALAQPTSTPTSTPAATSTPIVVTATSTPTAVVVTATPTSTSDWPNRHARAGLDAEHAARPTRNIGRRHWDQLRRGRHRSAAVQRRAGRLPAGRHDGSGQLRVQRAAAGQCAVPGGGDRQDTWNGQCELHHCGDLAVALVTAGAARARR